MRTRLIAAVLALVLAAVLPRAAIGQYHQYLLDAGGWIAPTTVERSIYVDADAANDSADGLTPATPKKTIAAGLALIRDGHADWVYLQRGDTWTVNSTLSWPSSSGGVSWSMPAGIGSYGSGSDRPVIITNADVNGIDVFGGSSARSYIVVRDIELRGSGVTSRDQSQRGSDKTGLRFWSAGGQGLAVENVKISGYNQSIGFYGNATGSELAGHFVNRSVFINPKGSNTTCVFSQYTKDGTYVDNVVGMELWNWLDSTQRLSHGFYTSPNLTGLSSRDRLLGNIAFCAGLAGFKVPGAVLAENNVAINCSFGIEIGGNPSNTDSIIADGAVITRNVGSGSFASIDFTGGSTYQDGQQEGLFIGVQWDGGAKSVQVVENIYLGVNLWNRNARAIKLKQLGTGSSITIARNKIIGGGSYYATTLTGDCTVKLESPGAIALSITQNTFRNRGPQGLIGLDGTGPASVYASGNTFSHAAPSGQWWWNSGGAANAAAWQDMTSEVPTISPPMTTAARDVLAEYAASLGYLPSSYSLADQRLSRERYGTGTKAWDSRLVGSAVYSYVDAATPSGTAERAARVDWKAPPAPALFDTVNYYDGLGNGTNPAGIPPTRYSTPSEANAYMVERAGVGYVPIKLWVYGGRATGYNVAKGAGTASTYVCNPENQSTHIASVGGTTYLRALFDSEKLIGSTLAALPRKQHYYVGATKSDAWTPAANNILGANDDFKLMREFWVAHMVGAATHIDILPALDYTVASCARNAAVRAAWTGVELWGEGSFGGTSGDLETQTSGWFPLLEGVSGIFDASSTTSPMSIWMGDPSTYRSPWLVQSFGSRPMALIIGASGGSGGFASLWTPWAAEFARMGLDVSVDGGFGTLGEATALSTGFTSAKSRSWQSAPSGWVDVRSASGVTGGPANARSLGAPSRAHPDSRQVISWADGYQGNTTPDAQAADAASLSTTSGTPKYVIFQQISAAWSSLGAEEFELGLDACKTYADRMRSNGVRIGISGLDQCVTWDTLFASSPWGASPNPQSFGELAIRVHRGNLRMAATPWTAPGLDTGDEIVIDGRMSIGRSLADDLAIVRTKIELVRAAYRGQSKPVVVRFEPWSATTGFDGQSDYGAGGYALPSSSIAAMTRLCRQMRARPAMAAEGQPGQRKAAQFTSGKTCVQWRSLNNGELRLSSPSVTIMATGLDFTGIPNSNSPAACSAIALVIQNGLNAAASSWNAGRPSYMPALGTFTVAATLVPVENTPLITVTDATNYASGTRLDVVTVLSASNFPAGGVNLVGGGYIDTGTTINSGARDSAEWRKVVPVAERVGTELGVYEPLPIGGIVGAGVGGGAAVGGGVLAWWLRRRGRR